MKQDDFCDVVMSQINILLNPVECNLLSLPLQGIQVSRYPGIQVMWDAAAQVLSKLQRSTCFFFKYNKKEDKGKDFLSGGACCSLR